MKIKSGAAFISPHPAILFALEVVNLWWRARLKRAPVVTSGRDGEHSEGSLHYGIPGDFRERAFDIRIKDLNAVEAKQAQAALDILLGPCFDVVLEADHIHIEYQPKIS